jgi:hypothetical protein
MEYMIGETWRRMGDKAKAQEWFKKVLDRPDSDSIKQTKALAKEQAALVQ